MDGLIDQTSRRANNVAESSGKKDWETPALTLLGDVETLTSSGTAITVDGGIAS